MLSSLISQEASLKDIKAARWGHLGRGRAETRLSWRKSKNTCRQRVVERKREIQPSTPMATRVELEVHELELLITCVAGVRDRSSSPAGKNHVQPPKRTSESHRQKTNTLQVQLMSHSLLALCFGLRWVPKLNTILLSCSTVLSFVSLCCLELSRFYAES